MPFHAGEIVFFRHPKHSWVLGKVTASNPDPKIKGALEYTCSADDAERQCVGEVTPKLKEEDITSCREDLIDEEPDDLLSLTVLHDSTLLRCLYLRYMRDIIYTNIGAIVVALNPFNFKIPWYLDSKMPEYLKEGPVIEKNLPHSWAQAHNTYHEMMQDGQAQTILVSGESGAGKTEASKIVMKYLAAISNQRGTDEEKAAGLAVGTRLNACSPLLEAFGNARTVRNDNSSRFGKFMKIKFSTEGQLKGAFTIKYLLERSRIVTAAENERIYHAFYIVVRGSYKEKLQILPEQEYKSLNAGKCLQNSEFNNAEDFQEVIDSMKKVGMTQEAIDSTWNTVAGVLTSQNIKFLEDGEGSKVADSDRKYLESLGKYWKIDVAKLEKEYTTTTLVIAGDKNTRLLRPVMAVDVRDALSKSLYNGLFGWLVEKCNELCDDPTANGSWIGLLDIFGFEDFEYNSFEQICINLTNETLQNHYNTYIFDRDMAECRAEGIDVADIQCPDNKPCLRLITAPGGIMALLDEECSLGKGTDLQFLEKIDQAHGNGKNAFFDKKKTSRDTFIIKHYAAPVTYTVTNWLEKNRDTIKDDIRLILRASSDPNIAGYLEAPIPIDQQKGKKVTVGGFFKDQMNQLMEVINNTNPHWIRCIKPHPAKKPKMFDGVQTLNQLESSGVLGTVKIRKAGYPIRTIFTKFNMRYRILLPGGKVKGDDRETSSQILKACAMDNPKFAQIGKTKVFMKSEAFPLIERKRNDLLALAGKTLQRVGRGHLQRLQTNKEWCTNTLRVAAKTIVLEYREYLRRSRAVREERARLRREAELKFRGLRVALLEEMEKEKEAIFIEFSKKTYEFVDERNQAIEKEKIRIEYFRGARETFAKQETMARIRLFEEFTSHLSYLSELYFKEIAVFYEVEALFAIETESHQRNLLEEDESETRNRLWRIYVESQSRGLIESIAAEGINSKNGWYAAEELQRQEMYARLAISRSQLLMRKHFARQLVAVGAETKQLESARLEYEEAQQKEILFLQRLRQKEIKRLFAEEGKHVADSRSLISGGGTMFAGAPTESPSEQRLFRQSKAAIASSGIVPPLLQCAPDDLNPFSSVGYERIRQNSSQPQATESSQQSFLYSRSSPSRAGYIPEAKRSHSSSAHRYVSDSFPRSAYSLPAGNGQSRERERDKEVWTQPSIHRGFDAAASAPNAAPRTAAEYMSSTSAMRGEGDTYSPPHPRSGAGAALFPSTESPYAFLHGVVTTSGRSLGRGRGETPPSPPSAASPMRGEPEHYSKPANAHTVDGAVGGGGGGSLSQDALLRVRGTGTITYPEAVMRSLHMTDGRNSTGVGNYGGRAPSAPRNGFGASPSSPFSYSTYQTSGVRSALDPHSTHDLIDYVNASSASRRLHQQGVTSSDVRGGRADLAPHGVSSQHSSLSRLNTNGTFDRAPRAASASLSAHSPAYMCPQHHNSSDVGLFDVCSPSPKPAQQQLRNSGATRYR